MFPFSCQTLNLQSPAASLSASISMSMRQRPFLVRHVRWYIPSLGGGTSPQAIRKPMTWFYGKLSFSANSSVSTLGFLTAEVSECFQSTKPGLSPDQHSKWKNFSPAAPVGYRMELKFLESKTILHIKSSTRRALETGGTMWHVSCQTPHKDSKTIKQHVSQCSD